MQHAVMFCLERNNKSMPCVANNAEPGKLSQVKSIIVKAFRRWNGHIKQPLKVERDKESLMAMSLMCWVSLSHGQSTYSLQVPALKNTG